MNRLQSELATSAGRLDSLEEALRDKTAAFQALEQLLDDKGREVREIRKTYSQKTRELGQKISLSLLLESGALAPAAARILEALCENFEWDVGILWRVDEGANELVCLDAWTKAAFRERHADFLDATRRGALRSWSALPWRVWESGVAASVFDVASEASGARSETAELAGLHSTCAFPVTVDHRVAFVFELLSREFREPAPMLMENFATLAKQLGQFLELQRAKEAYQKSELSVARKIQTSILPRTLRVEGLEIAARMLPAEEVGGDYFDVLPESTGCWIGIGDVTGHGLAAGIVMVMVQSAIAALSNAHLDAAPSQLVRILNATLFENIRKRLVGNDHVTLSLLRYHFDGRFEMAGAHEELIVYRARSRQCERIPTPGTWVGATADIGAVTVDTTYRLEVGDLLVLYTDGLTEARSVTGEQFGLDRICSVLELHHDEPAETIRDCLFDAVLRWMPVPDDDITILVVRYRGVEPTTSPVGFGGAVPARAT